MQINNFQNKVIIDFCVWISYNIATIYINVWSIVLPPFSFNSLALVSQTKYSKAMYIIFKWHNAKTKKSIFSNVHLYFFRKPILLKSYNNIIIPCDMVIINRNI